MARCSRNTPIIIIIIIIIIIVIIIIIIIIITVIFLFSGTAKADFLSDGPVCLLQLYMNMLVNESFLHHIPLPPHSLPSAPHSPSCLWSFLGFVSLLFLFLI